MIRVQRTCFFLELNLLGQEESPLIFTCMYNSILLLLLLLLYIFNYFVLSKVASTIAIYGFSGGLLIIAMLLIKICKCYYLIK